MSTSIEASLTCSLLISDQPRGAVVEERNITQLYLLDSHVINVTAIKTQSYARNKSSLGKVCLILLH